MDDVLQNTSVFASVLVVFTAKRSENEQKSGMAEGWHGNRGSRELKRRKIAVLELPGGPRRLNSQLHAPRVDLKKNQRNNILSRPALT
ncbi:hypothetical protein HanRHA438_Chr17g0835241 [Helianthus annuus]|nr:hypothetical protein HanRHA438_Chr17g0835241 [Helianthus annuus]